MDHRPKEWDKVWQILDEVRPLPHGLRLEAARHKSETDELFATVSKLLAAELESDEFLEESGPIRYATLLEDDDLTGTAVGSYRLDSQIGSGGMGVVYLASRADGEFEKEVAIKFLRRGLIRPGTFDRFKSEAFILASLSHPQVAQLFDAGTTTDGIPYLVMEYVDGSSITEYCKQNNLATAARLALVRQLLDALAFAHENGIVHRDIKPSNILVADGAVKLVDFGIAQVVSTSAQSGDGVRYNSLSTHIASPEYAAPELSAGAETTTATDIYSVGILLCELVTGSRDPHSMDNVRRGVDPRLRAVVLKCLESEPALRYPSAASLNQELGRVISDRPVDAFSSSTTQRMSLFGRRHKSWIVSLLLLCMATATPLLCAYENNRRVKLEFAKTSEQLRQSKNSIRDVASLLLSDDRDESLDKLVYEMLDLSHSDDSDAKEWSLRVNDLANRLSYSGNSAEAVIAFDAALRTIDGVRDTDTLRATIIGNLGLALHRQREFTTARKVLQQPEVQLGRHQTRIKAGVLLGSIISVHDGDHIRAADSIEAWLQTSADVLGMNHSQTRNARLLLGRAFIKANRLGQADSILTLEMNQSHGTDRLSLMAIDLLARTKQLRGLEAEATGLRKLVLSQRASGFVVNDKPYREYLEFRIVSEINDGRYDEAAEIASSLLEVATNLLSTTNPQLAETEELVGSTYMLANRFDLSAASYSRALGIRDGVSSPPDSLVLTLIGLGKAQTRSGSCEESKDSLERAVSLATSTEQSAQVLAEAQDALALAAECSRQ